ncbi:MAG: nucleoside triphosphate pyrophosphohydrolase [Pseudomonadota bacterium]
MAWILGGGTALERLRRTMAFLRSDRGCPWDRKQTHQTLIRYAVEEAHELGEAAARGDHGAIREELGDLLLQVVFHAQIAAESGLYDLSDVAQGICEKLWRRHPHVFGDDVAETPEDVEHTWERTKARENGGTDKGLLDGVPRSLPALGRCHRISERASRVGFDFQDPEQVLAKLLEEAAELVEARGSGDPVALRHEVGDLLFAAANLARQLGVEPEDALQGSNDRFTARFRRVEQGIAARGGALQEATMDEMETLWQAAKADDADRNEA